MAHYDSKGVWGAPPRVRGCRGDAIPLPSNKNRDIYS